MQKTAQILTTQSNVVLRPKNIPVLAFPLLWAVFHIFLRCKRSAATNGLIGFQTDLKYATSVAASGINYDNFLVANVCDFQDANAFPPVILWWVRGLGAKNLFKWGCMWHWRRNQRRKVELTPKRQWQVLMLPFGLEFNLRSVWMQSRLSNVNTVWRSHQPYRMNLRFFLSSIEREDRYRFWPLSIQSRLF